MRFSFFLAGLLLAVLSPAATYYISPSGNDSHSGTSPGQAWRTLARVAQVQYALQPGDQVLFERGGVFRGELPVGSSGTEGAPLVFGAYGTGAAPVIAGSDAVTGWTQHQGNIWRAPVSSAVSHLFVDGQLMTLARYPNTGWLRMNSGTPTSLHDADLGQPAGYWTGAQAVIRASHWSYDVAEITGYSDHTLHFPSIGESPGNYTWGYFLQGKLSELDMPGEWHYDAAAGMLYLHAPGNADPNTLQVEASVRANGAVIAWQRQYVRIQDLAFRHQHGACVRNDGGNRITVANCSFTQAYHGVRSYGSLNTYTGCTFTELYATGAHLIDNGTEFSDNQMHDIANRPGLGESLWGYFGVRAAGSDIVLRGNVLDNIGYIGLAVDNNALVEHNVVENCLMTLNDGGGITFDFADGIIVRNNIVRNMVGNMESAAPEHPNSVLTSHGIYFGNTSIRNTLVQGNTVTGCAGSGIHVDHTMVSSGNAIKDNVLFGNGVQLSISDFSNYNGPGAQPPYHKPSFDGVYSGNVLYALSKDQLCMRQYSCYNATPVEFGTFSNNYYYNPYNELSILMVNTFAYGETYYTLERWQADRGQDAGSSRSPLRLPGHATVAELGGNLVQNGGFNAHVNGWSGWPANAQVSHVTGQLDGGALRAYLPNNSQYNSFTLNSPDHFPVQDQAWYRLRFSLKSDAHGEVVVGLKGQSQNDVPQQVWNRKIPFDTERRDLEMYFQSGLTDQARVQFTNQWTQPMYYLDNVELVRVEAQPLDPLQRHKLFVNEQATPQQFSLPPGCWKDIDGNVLQGSIQVPAFGSRVAWLFDGPDCSVVVPAGGVRVKMLLGGAMDGSDALMRDDLRALGLLPASEPYSDMGHAVENAGQAASPAVMQATGPTAVVDWVLVQLHQANAGYSVAGRRAGLLLRNGKVVMPDGNDLITFNGDAVGKHVSVRHRNHLGSMSALPVATDGETMDFTQYATPVFGTDARMIIDGRMALWPGNVLGIGTVKYTGPDNGRDGILQLIGLNPNNVVGGYRAEDTNLDGFVSYTGPNNDRDVVLLAIGGLSGTTVRVEGMP